MRGSELEKDRESEKRTDVVRERERKVERKRENRCRETGIYLLFIGGSSSRPLELILLC